jgi:hypothetical protein
MNAHAGQSLYGSRRPSGLVVLLGGKSRVCDAQTLRVDRRGYGVNWHFDDSEEDTTAYLPGVPPYAIGIWGSVVG